MRTLTTIIFVLLISACATQTVERGRVVGHRLVYLEPAVAGDQGESSDGQTSPLDALIRIALTNASEHTLCGATATVVGLETKAVGEEYKNVKQPNAETSWEPGGVWLLKVEEKFDCNIPILVRVSYAYHKDSDRVIYENRKKGANGKKGVQMQGIDLCAEPEARSLVPLEDPESVELPKVPTAIPRSDLIACRQ